MSAPTHRFHGPKAWAASSIAGAAIGAILSRALPGAYGDHAAIIPLWLVIPFAALLASIALMPFINPRLWHAHFPDFAFFLGAIVAAYYLLAFDRPGYEHALTYGQAKLLHAVVEYYSFVALVCGLFVVSGGILVDARGRGGPLINTTLLAAGAILANLVGTTGASMLLIRPFMRLNAGRLRPIHVVLFIFIVSNCGGCLTPIGDPPLYLGFLKGVPFFWTLEMLWTDFLLVVGLLLAVFFVIDSRIAPAPAGAGQPTSIRIRGTIGLIALALMVLGVFIDPALKAFAHIEGIPIGATFQVGVAVAAHRLAPRDILKANEFSFFPAKEVGLLFFGIFLTMVPALGYLASHGASLGITGPTRFYWTTGALSATLDNAPTYLNFLQIAFGEHEINAAGIREFLGGPAGPATLIAISTGAVFFGAMTYIGNGPNFMVKAIAEASGVRMPSFFGYLLRALSILLPILFVHWLVFVR